MTANIISTTPNPKSNNSNNILKITIPQSTMKSSSSITTNNNRFNNYITPRSAPINSNNFGLKEHLFPEFNNASVADGLNNNTNNILVTPGPIPGHCLSLYSLLLVFVFLLLLNGISISSAEFGLVPLRLAHQTMSVLNSPPLQINNNNNQNTPNTSPNNNFLLPFDNTPSLQSSFNPKTHRNIVNNFNSAIPNTIAQKRDNDNIPQILQLPSITGHKITYLFDEGLHPPTSTVSQRVLANNFSIIFTIELQWSISNAPVQSPTIAPAQPPSNTFTHPPSSAPIQPPSLSHISSYIMLRMLINNLNNNNIIYNGYAGIYFQQNNLANYKTNWFSNSVAGKIQHDNINDLCAPPIDINTPYYWLIINNNIKFISCANVKILSPTIIPTCDPTISFALHTIRYLFNKYFRLLLNLKKIATDLTLMARHGNNFYYLRDHIPFQIINPLWQEHSDENTIYLDFKYIRIQNIPN